MKVLRIAMLVVAGGLLLNPVLAQQPADRDQHEHGAPAAQQGEMDHAKMMADMTAADARLESLLQRMKTAQGSDKTQAMQDLLAEVVQNQLTMHHEMAMMHDHMMAQMPHK